MYRNHSWATTCNAPEYLGWIRAIFRLDLLRLQLPNLQAFENPELPYIADIEQDGPDRGDNVTGHWLWDIVVGMQAAGVT
jgi:hypothetical protein